ncbi:MAG: type II secretion system major pseudopilin GspG [bacterium]
MKKPANTDVNARLLSAGGFTFIELMMVILIISILATVVYPRIVGRSKDAKIAAASADIETISLALDLYFMDNGKYPSTSQGLDALNRKPTTYPLPSNWKGPYLKKKSDFKDPWENPYTYVSPGIHSDDYDIKSYGPDGQDGGEDDISSWED